MRSKRARGGKAGEYRMFSATLRYWLLEWDVSHKPGYIMPRRTPSVSITALWTMRMTTGCAMSVRAGAFDQNRAAA